MIGDKDPEDAWDEGDPPAVRLGILERVVEHLRASRDWRFEARRADALRLVDKLKRERDVDNRRLRLIRRALKAM